MARIVLIDDDHAMRGMLMQMLTRLGHQVFSAADGKSGLKAVSEHQPELLITDIFMPEMDGVETILALRRTAPQIKIIAISGGGRTTHGDYLPIARKLGARVTLAKPFDREEIKTAVETALA